MVLQNQSCPLCNATKLRGLYERRSHGVTWRLGHCESCGLHFTDPTPTEDQIRQFYSGDYHQELRTAGASERAFEARFTRYIDWISKFLPSGRSLDVGCATGLLPRMLKDRGYDAEGIELHPETAQWGSRHYGLPIHNETLERLAARHAETSQPGYDLVTLTEVVEHTGNPVEFLRTANSILKPGGFALVTFPDISSLNSSYFRMLSRITGRGWLWITCQIPHHIWEFTHPTAVATFQRAGFSVAGFRRVEGKWSLPGKLAVLTWPVLPLQSGALARRFGTQMEFMLLKNR